MTPPGCWRLLYDWRDLIDCCRLFAADASLCWSQYSVSVLNDVVYDVALLSATPPSNSLDDIHECKLHREANWLLKLCNRRWLCKSETHSMIACICMEMIRFSVLILTCFSPCPHTPAAAAAACFLWQTCDCERGLCERSLSRCLCLCSLCFDLLSKPQSNQQQKKKNSR